MLITLGHTLRGGPLFQSFIKCKSMWFTELLFIDYWWLYMTMKKPVTSMVCLPECPWESHLYFWTSFPIHEGTIVIQNFPVFQAFLGVPRGNLICFWISLQHSLLRMLFWWTLKLDVWCYCWPSESLCPCC